MDLEEFNYSCSKNIGADQLCGYRKADLHLCFRIGNMRFSDVVKLNNASGQSSHKWKHVEKSCQENESLKGISVFIT